MEQLGSNVEQYFHFLIYDLHFSSPCVPTSGSELRKDLVAAEGLHQDMPEDLDPNVKDLACHVMACLCTQALKVLLTYSSFLQQLFLTIVTVFWLLQRIHSARRVRQ